MQIAILYICTGKYSIFWNDFYVSAKKYFLSKYEKHFFVFTDDKKLLKESLADVTFVYQNKLGWPLDTLHRFKLFLRIEDTLNYFDYIYYINANAVIVSDVNEEIIPSPFLFIGSQHPCYYDKNPEQFIYDRNIKSTAYVEIGGGAHYVMGAFIGGEAEAFISMCKELNQNIDKDYEQNIIAIWHDESHYNKYLVSNPYKLLSPAYVYPEEMNLPFKPKILLRDKRKYGGHNYLRSIKKELNILTTIKHWIKNK